MREEVHNILLEINAEIAEDNNMAPSRGDTSMYFASIFLEYNLDFIGQSRLWFIVRFYVVLVNLYFLH